MRLSLRLDGLTLVEIALFEPDQECNEYHELNADTEPAPPFGFCADWPDEDEDKAHAATSPRPGSAVDGR